jgi:hypothetical protein
MPVAGLDALGASVTVPGHVRHTMGIEW